MEERQTLTQFLEAQGMTEEQAMDLLYAVAQARSTNRERAQEVLRAIEAIGDEGFSVDALLKNPEALRALEMGENPGKVYRIFFMKAPAQVRQETQANLGLADPANPRLSRDVIERISEYVDRTGKSYSM